jgi:hypothetical protein
LRDRRRLQCGQEQCKCRKQAEKTFHGLTLACGSGT